VTDDSETPRPTCAKCGVNPAGPGGILCDGCREEIERGNRERRAE
jgi:hypothetical protein